MSDIQFEGGENYSRPFQAGNAGESGMTKLVIKMGFAKDEKSANVVLVIFTILIAILAYIVYFYL